MNIELLGLEARHPAALPSAPAALRALNLRLTSGEQVAIIGPSGAGKTTLLQVLASPLANGQTGLSRLLAGAGQTRYKLRATGAPFEAKDKLKARGYRWDGEGRVWWCSLASDTLLSAECDWLREEVYGRRNARIQVEALDSRVQYSNRSGQLSERAV